MKLAKTYTYLKKDLEIIETALQQVIQAEHPVLRNASTQLLKAGGKRIRPVFVLLSGQFGDFNREKVNSIAVSLELIHMATLVHDDVIDDAELRRGELTIRHQYDNRVAMYTGDYILARALENIAEIKEPAIHDTLSKAIVEVCIGEIEQIKDKYDLRQNLRVYLRRIKRKTALLIATSCKLGAISAGLPDYEVHMLYRYGYFIGMSYQIIDDILDFTSSEKQLGKPAGNDLIQGNITLPILIAREDKAFEQRLSNLFKHPNKINAGELTDLITHLKELKAIEKSYQMSDRYLQKAMAAIEPFPNSKPKATLQQIAMYIGKRRM
ncbi:heptaprenyl diphosphate synthase component II [Ornithinibacillus gellani]|uniref:heptaprenyl diphosphate synthase component II n=1 Tax=Ornithinibacillus gellani TaxID=2293253 RepID=UPI000F466D1F|nr:heptaprenyl diphosphate synthase component II [Ornithinibacillus gellani]TQS74417.1 heptaprenyl diphosphate synthase component II [Ornithinibacillus gellani]